MWWGDSICFCFYFLLPPGLTRKVSVSHTEASPVPASLATRVSMLSLYRCKGRVKTASLVRQSASAKLTLRYYQCRSFTKYLTHLSLSLYVKRPSQWLAPPPTYRISVPGLPSHLSATTSSLCATRVLGAPGSGSSVEMSARLWRTACVMPSTPLPDPIQWSSCSWSYPVAICYHDQGHLKLLPAWG